MLERIIFFVFIRKIPHPPTHTPPNPVLSCSVSTLRLAEFILKFILQDIKQEFYRFVFRIISTAFFLLLSRLFFLLLLLWLWCFWFGEWMTTKVRVVDAFCQCRARCFITERYFFVIPRCFCVSLTRKVFYDSAQCLIASLESIKIIVIVVFFATLTLCRLRFLLCCSLCCVWDKRPFNQKVKRNKFIPQFFFELKIFVTS